MEIELFSVKVKISFLFFAVLTLLLCYNVSFEIKLALLFSILHEFGHISALAFFGRKPERILFGAFGLTIVKSESSGYREDFTVAFCGPAVNIILSVLFFFVFQFYKKEIILNCAVINLLIAAFNLAPIFSLDGGRMLEAFLNSRYSPLKAEKVLKLVSFAAVLTVTGMGFFVLTKSRYNFTLLLIGIYLTVTLFVKC